MAQSFLEDEYDSAMKIILGTHRPDGAKINLQPVLDVIDKILSRANNSIKDAHLLWLQGKCDTNILTTQTVQSAGSIGPLASVIHKVSCELQCNCSGGDAHESTIVIMKMLEKYEWDAKAVIAIAAFAQIYGEFYLFAQLYLAHPLAKEVAILKNLPTIAEHGSTHQDLFGLVEALIGAIVELAKVMDQFDQLNLKYIPEDMPPLSNTLPIIHESAYWIIFSVVVCTQQIARLAGVLTEKTTPYSVANLTEGVNQYLIAMKENLDECVIIEGCIEREENYERLKNIIENVPSAEKILEVIFDWEKSNLISCTGEKQDKKIFRDKKVLILISGLDITSEEIAALAELYKKWQKERKSEQQVEIVWLPVIENRITRETCQQKLKELRELMPWYTIEHPSFIKEEGIRYIKQEWHFSRKTILVALDSSGKVQSKNALDMLWIWGDLVFDFNEKEEISLWRNSFSVVELIFCRSDHTIDFTEVTTGIKKVVCFYGGEDIEWIKKFTSLTKKVADIAKIKMKLIYVGKSTHLDKVKKNIEETWSETTIWLFWTRLKNILCSSTKITNLIKTTLLNQIASLLTLDANANGWAVFCGGSTKLTIMEGYHALSILDTMAQTSANWKDKGFVFEVETQVEKLTETIEISSFWTMRSGKLCHVLVVLP